MTSKQLLIFTGKQKKKLKGYSRRLSQGSAIMGWHLFSFGLIQILSSEYILTNNTTQAGRKKEEEGGGGERQAGDRKDGGLPPGLTHSPQIARTSREQGASVSGWISSGTRTSDSSTASGWANSQTRLSPPLTPWGWGSPSEGGCLQREKAECTGPRWPAASPSQPCSLPGAPIATSMCRNKLHAERRLALNPGPATESCVPLNPPLQSVSSL